MADPPQIAVPAEISAETLRSIPSRLPKTQPNPSVVAMVAAAKPAPCRPVRSTTGRSIPKPNKTTQTCSSLAETLLPRCANGFSWVRARIDPNARASGGETHGVKQNAAATMKMAGRMPRGSAAGSNITGENRPALSILSLVLYF
jgi:hypothetical protein